MKKTILIVDDDAFIVSIYAAKLNVEGYEVIHALDGEAGFAMAKETKPDLILLDILMPKLDGFEVLEKLKATPETKDIPVLMLSGMGQKEDIDRGLKAGAVDYLLKSQALPADTVEKIRKIIG